MPLESLTYMSTAAHLPTQGEIEHLLHRARARNERENITGVLLYSEGTFLQCIEGETASLDRVFASICADPLHHHLFEMLRDPIDQREFAEWSMAFRSTGKKHVFNANLALLTERLEAPEGTLSPVRHLLSAFWNGGMGARYQAAIGGMSRVAR